MMSVQIDRTSEMKIFQLQVGPNDINALMQIVALHIFSEEQPAGLIYCLPLINNTKEKRTIYTCGFEG